MYIVNVFVYMYICIYVYMSIFVYVYMYICKYVYMYIYKISTYIYMYKCIFFICIYTCINVYIYICIYIYIYVFTYIYICINITPHNHTHIQYVIFHQNAIFCGVASSFYHRLPGRGTCRKRRHASWTRSFGGREIRFAACQRSPEVPLFEPPMFWHGAYGIQNGFIWKYAAPKSSRYHFHHNMAILRYYCCWE